MPNGGRFTIHIFHISCNNLKNYPAEMGLRTHIHRNPLIRWEFNKIRYENWANQSRSVWIDSQGWVELRYDWWNHGRCVLLHKLVLWIRIVIFPQVEANVLRSSTGDVSDYKLLPWAIPKQSLYEHWTPITRMFRWRTLSTVPIFRNSRVNSNRHCQSRPILATNAWSMAMGCQKLFLPVSIWL